MRRRSEQHHRDHRHHKHEDGLHKANINQQQLGVEDKQEGQQRGTDVVGETLNTGFDRIAAGDRRRRKGGQTHRWRVVSEDAEIEHKEVNRDQRHDQALLRAH